MNFAMLALDLAKVLTKHFCINTEKEIQAQHQNYSKWFLLESFAYCVRFGMNYDDFVGPVVATGGSVRYGGGIAPVLWADVVTVRAG